MCAGAAHIHSVMSVTTKVRKSRKAKAAPAKAKKYEGRKERLVARVSRRDKAVIAEAASMNGQSVASFVISQAKRAAASTVNDYRRIRLNAEQSTNFVKALLAPVPQIPEGLVRSAKRYRAVVSSL